MSKKILKLIVAALTVCVAVIAVACTPFGIGAEPTTAPTPVIATPESTATPSPTVPATPTPTPSPSGSPEASLAPSPGLVKPAGAITPDPSLYPNASTSPAATAPAGAPTTSPSTKTAHSHTFTTTKVPATTESQGYTIYQCTGCEFSYRDNYTPKLRANSSTSGSTGTTGSTTGSSNSTGSNSTGSSTTTKKNDPYLDDSGSWNDPYSDDYREDYGTHTPRYYRTTDSRGNVIYRCDCGSYYYPDDDYRDYGDGRYDDIYAD